jgi:hypothetical protein
MKKETRTTLISVGVVAGAGILAYLLFRPKKSTTGTGGTEIEPSNGGGGGSGGGGFVPSAQCLKDVKELGYGTDVRGFQRDWNEVRAYINVVVSAGEATAQYIASLFGITVGNLNDELWKVNLAVDGDCGPKTSLRSAWVLRGGVLVNPAQNWGELVKLAYDYTPMGS